MKILIVDDSIISRDVLKKTLTMNGYSDIIEGSDGQKGWEQAQKYKEDISLYILDINMPEMDGLTLLGKIKGIDPLTPVIMLTTETDKSKVDRARSQGATGWIVKPFEAEKLINVIQMVLKK